MGNTEILSEKFRKSSKVVSEYGWVIFEYRFNFHTLAILMACSGLNWPLTIMGWNFQTGSNNYAHYGSSSI
jgi:hypothetical protein